MSCKKKDHLLLAKVTKLTWSRISMGISDANVTKDRDQPGKVNWQINKASRKGKKMIK